MHNGGRWAVAWVAALMLVLVPMSVSADDDLWPPMPGVGAKASAGVFYSVPCGCFDRHVVAAELSGRLHFGDVAAVEADWQPGTMLLGGNFPSQAWALGGRMRVIPQLDQWWDRVSLRAGYRNWQTMGMRADSSHGLYSAINWSVEVFPHIYVESDVMAQRVFRDMPHWSFDLRLGLATRF